MFGFNRKNVIKSEAKTAAVVRRSAVMIETLESRELMSVAPVAKPKVAPAPKAAIVVPAKPAPVVKAVVAKAAPVPAVAVAAAKPATTMIIGGSVRPAVPIVVGTWTGTMLVDGKKVAAPWSVNFAFQRNVAASGTFNLGATMGNQVAVSTLVFDGKTNLRILISNSSLFAGFTGWISTNGQIINGRFAWNTAKGWQTGTFQLKKS